MLNLFLIEKILHNSQQNEAHYRVLTFLLANMMPIIMDDILIPTTYADLIHAGIHVPWSPDTCISLNNNFPRHEMENFKTPSKPI
jgi:hypothetical protein